MTDQNVTSGCGEIRRLLSAFLADELSAPESRRVQGHLDLCAACAGFQGLEGAFDGAMRRALKREAAPAGLVVRVHRALDREDEEGTAGVRRPLARPWVRWALAASVLLVILGPGVVGVRTGLLRLPVAMAGVSRSTEGTLVCAECMRHGREIARQRGCRAHGHHTALKTDTGDLWEFVDTHVSRPLITGADRIGDRVRVEGLFIDDLHYVRVDAYRYVEGGEEALQGL